MPAWPCAGPPPPCSRPPRASAGSRRSDTFRRSVPLSPHIGRGPGPTLRLRSRPAPLNVTLGRAARHAQHRAGHLPQNVRGYLSSQSLTVRATPSLATKWLLPRLGRFLDANPALDVRVDATNEPTDFSREGVDVDIRHGEGNWPGLFVEGIAEERFLPACAPALCAPATLEPSDLPRHRLIHSVKSQMQWGRWFVAAGVTATPTWRRVLFDRSHMAVDAAISGIGIALESDLMMWRELRDGVLACPVRHPPPASRVTQWLVCPHDRLRRRQVRAFLDWVRAERDSWLAARAGQAGVTV